jgi:hypothetical protein
MSTITKTNFRHVSFIVIIEGVGFSCLGHGEHAPKCNITNGEGQRFIRDDPINLFYIGMKIENGIGCQKLGSRVL